ncbi:MAG: hypothetical protein J4F34_07080 [Gemmatimonadetes bacterium]|nr:hypothetical protein [Gemmatimonadota bacterium]
MTDTRVQPVDADVAAAVLSAMRAIDRPDEMLEDEIFGHTMPRRLGLSGVVERQIELYSERSRQGKGLGPDELAQLIGVVVRRSDAATILYMAGTYLADGCIPKRRRWQPREGRLDHAKRTIQRNLDGLFGRGVGSFAAGSSRLEAADSPLARLDPSGDVCAIVTGFCQRALDRAIGKDLKMVKVSCRSEGEGHPCAWRIEV